MSDAAFDTLDEWEQGDWREVYYAMEVDPDGRA